MPNANQTSAAPDIVTAATRAAALAESGTPILDAIYGSTTDGGIADALDSAVRDYLRAAGADMDGFRVHPLHRWAEGRGATEVAATLTGTAAKVRLDEIVARANASCRASVEASTDPADRALAGYWRARRDLTMTAADWRSYGKSATVLGYNGMAAACEKRAAAMEVAA